MNDPGSVRRKLWKVNKLCFWCGKETIWFEGHDGVSPKNGCTLDHLYRISDPRRSIVPSSVVLACSDCNRIRAEEQTKGKKISDLFPQNTEVSLIDTLDAGEPSIEAPVAAQVHDAPKRRSIDISALWGGLKIKVR